MRIGLNLDKRRAAGALMLGIAAGALASIARELMQHLLVETTLH